MGGCSSVTHGAFPGKGLANSRLLSPAGYSRPLSDPVLIIAFLAAAAVSMATSWVLVSRLERVGARLGLSEALLGLLAALAADAPEITVAVSALVRHRARTGTGVAIGSNVFNLAALLGLSAVVAGRIPSFTAG